MAPHLPLRPRISRRAASGCDERTRNERFPPKNGWREVGSVVPALMKAKRAQVQVRKSSAIFQYGGSCPRVRFHERRLAHYSPRHFSIEEGIFMRIRNLRRELARLTALSVVAGAGAVSANTLNVCVKREAEWRVVRGSVWSPHDETFLTLAACSSGDCSDFRGPAGAAGPQGAAGPIGPQGLQGDVGPQGPAGVAGPGGPLRPLWPLRPPWPGGAEGGAGAQGPPGGAGPTWPERP